MSVPTLLLPLTRGTVDSLLSNDNTEEFVHTASGPELAAVYAALQAPKISKSGSVATVVEKSIFQLTVALKEPDQLRSFRIMLSEAWSLDAFSEGIRVLEDARVGFSDQESITRQSFLDLETGSWDFQYTERRLQELSPFKERIETRSGEVLQLEDTQARIFRQIESEMDEPVSLQGYAGTGKTHLIRSLLSILDAKRTVVLALTVQQLDALMKRLGNPDVLGFTFGQMAAFILDRDTSFSFSMRDPRRRSNYQVSDRHIALGLQFDSVGSMPPEQVARACRRTVMSFSMTGDEWIGDHHIPALQDTLSKTDRWVLIEYANRLWAETIQPTRPNIQLPMRAYHVIKALALSDNVIPAKYTHILIDEGHDLSKPMMQILDRTPQSAITLGDKFQRLNGTSPHRDRRIRQREMNVSVRAGREIESVLNPILDAHPESIGLPLIGTRQHQTVVRFYDRPAIPDQPTTLLVGTEWHLFEWFQRLANEKAKYNLLQGSMNQFQAFVEGCIGLYSNNTRSNHPFLFRYPTWQSLETHHGGNPAFRRIEGMLKKGYGKNDLSRSLAQLSPPGQAKIWLGMVDAARNLEFDSIMLAPELLADVESLDTPATAATILSRLYTGCSRTKHELIVPGYMRDWLQDRTGPGSGATL